MQPLLLLICLLGFAISDNATVDEVSEITNTGNDIDVGTVEETIAWGEWSPWSKWSACTRSCDGGISHQQKRCRRKLCKGRPWNVRYKVCNVQPCEEASDFRAEQCAAFDNVPYSGQLLKWLPHYDPIRPCSLICRGLQALNDGTNDKKRIRSERVLPEAEDSLTELDVDETIVVQLADKVKDGTRCHPESLDVCIGGECMKVGCDLKVGSNKKKDVCGICGGNGSNCQSRYVWSLEPVSACSKPCGGGFKIAMIICKTVGSDQHVVEDSSCDPNEKPEKSLLPCNMHPCSKKWMTGEWSECSASCGGGSRTRLVFCSEENGNETNELPDHKCSGIHKPRHQETCNTFSCPMWETDQWSECSVSCGTGIRTRMVECQDGRGRHSLDCDSLERPQAEQECKTNVPCSFYGEDLTQPLMQAYPPPPVPEKLIDQPIPSESTFIAEEWSPCSVTCGEGIRHREVHCKIFLEFSRTIAKLPDRQCSGPKPVETEKCITEPCGLMGNSLPYSMDTIRDSGYAESSLKDGYRSSSGISSAGSYESSVKVAAGSTVQTTYSWKEAGYTHCSATCLGGIQELIITCVRDDTGKAVTPLLCTPETKPESRIRTCNDHPCPPRWNYSDFTPCMSPCGIGIQTRDVMCIHEVTRDTGNIVHVPNSMCPQPPPADRQYCNVLDCPAEWHVGDWSKCSRSCGGGLKRRTVACEQIVAQGHVQTRPESACSPEKPDSEKPCNTKTCHEMGLGAQSVILSLNTTFNQADPNKKVDLKIGGSATVFLGTSVVKIRCPVKKFDKAQITWTKDRVELRKTKKYKISRKGALRIIDITYSDRGTYACIAGQSQAEMHLFVKSRSREQMSSEEILRFGNTVHQDVNLDSAPSNSGENLHTDHAAPAYGSSFAIGSEDLSHEARFEGQMTSRPTKSPRRRKPRPSPLPPDSTMIHGEYTVTSFHQPGYQESVESTVASSGAKLVPHLNRLISSLKAYWPFQSDVASSRGHRMVPPLLTDDLRKDNPPTTRTLPERQQAEVRYDDMTNDYDFLQRNTAIPDEKFGPDEERIFIDDDPYDIDEATFALQHKDTLQNVPDVIAERRKNSVNPTKSVANRKDESVRNVKKQSPKDRYFRNQRGAMAEDFERERESIDRTDRPKINVYYVEDNARRDEKQDAVAVSTNFDRESIQGMTDASEDRQDTFTKEVSRIHDEQDTTKTPDLSVETMSDARSTMDDEDETISSRREFENDKSREHEQDNREELEVPVVASRETAMNQSKLVENGERILEEEPDRLGTSWNEESKNASRDQDEMIDKLEDVLSKDTFRSSKKFSKKHDRFGKTREVFTSDGFEDESTVTEESTVRPVLVLGKGESDDLLFEWMTTEWSRCSQTCGGGGFQVRSAQCTVRSTKPVSNSSKITAETLIGATLCEDAGYPVPQKVRSCGAGTCPQWNTGEWSPCESSRCFNWKTAMQKRDVSCRLIKELDDDTQNVTILNTSKCDDGIRPPQRQECYNDACKGVWRVGEWSDCTASCEENGIKYRLLQCVWFGTKKPAGNACRDIPRPSVMKTCKGPPCPQSPDECKDHSQLCGRVKMMNMCRVPLYQKQCCQSCR